MENGRKLLRWIALAAVTVLGLGGLSSLFESTSQAEVVSRPDVIHIDTIGQLKKLEMPPAIFLHDKHVAKLAKKGKDCSVCHLATPDGYSVKFQRQKDGKNPGKLEDLYHNGCIGCHADMNDGPQDGQCRLCHAENSELPNKKGTPVQFVAKRAPIELGDKGLHALHVASKSIVPDKPGPNCGVCHHVYDDTTKKLVWIPGTEEACSFCHGAKADGNKPSLQDATHATCVMCHVTTFEKERKQVLADAVKDKKKNRKLPRAEQKKAKEEALASIQTGPTTCAGCHTVEAQKQYKTSPYAPRLLRGQSDAGIILPVPNNAETPPTSAMWPVLFDHKAHEAATTSCQSCHHVRIASCTTCHTIEGKQEGNFVPLAAAMHNPESDRSCVGCHKQYVAQKPECAGCHFNIPSMAQESCISCHKEISGLSKEQVADGSVFKMKKDMLTGIALANVTIRKPVAPMSPDSIPETVVIGSLANEFEPSVFPHRKIYASLAKGMANSSLAAAFHDAPESTCAACHHHTPLQDLKNPPKCASCHSPHSEPATSDRPTLKMAYHQQCITCHEQMNITKPAATDCAGCHAPRKN